MLIIFAQRTTIWKQESEGNLYDEVIFTITKRRCSARFSDIFEALMVRGPDRGSDL